MKPFILDRDTWRDICAVEGITLSDETVRMFEEFDRLGLSAEERRARIIEKHQAKTLIFRDAANPK